MALPKMMKDKTLASFSQESSRGLLATVRALIVLLTHVPDIVDAVGAIGWEAREATMSEAEARKPEWEIRKRAVNEWRGEMLDALRWLKSGMCESLSLLFPFRISNGDGNASGRQQGQTNIPFPSSRVGRAHGHAEPV